MDASPPFLESSEMDVESEERSSGCEIHELTTKEAPLSLATLSATTEPPTAYVSTTTPKTTRSTRPFVYRGESLMIYMPRGGKESPQNSGSTALTEAQRRYLDILKTAIMRAEIKATVVHGRRLQPIKPERKPNQNNTGQTSNKPLKRMMANPASPIPMPRNGEFDQSSWLQSLQNGRASQAGNQGPSQNGSPQSGSNQNNLPQGGSPQSLASLSTRDKSISGTVSKAKNLIAWPMKDFRSKSPIKLPLVWRLYSHMHG